MSKAASSSMVGSKSSSSAMSEASSAVSTVNAPVVSSVRVQHA